MLTLKKSLGQHFLHDENVCRNIVALLPDMRGKNLLEIGPGGGALTKYLLALEGVNYVAVEYDREKVDYLLQQYPQAEGKILHQDFIKTAYPFQETCSLIGNFPYNISSSILFKLLEWEENIELVIGMFQKEVALRVAAKEGNKTYGILSVLIQAFYDVDYKMDVHEKCFTPSPKVKSGVIVLKNKHNPYCIENKSKFITLIKMAFGQRRKTLRNALKGYFNPELLREDVFNKRAEQLSVEEFVALFNIRR